MFEINHISESCDFKKPFQGILRQFRLGPPSKPKVVGSMTGGLDSDDVSTVT